MPRLSGLIFGIAALAAVAVAGQSQSQGTPPTTTPPTTTPPTGTAVGGSRTFGTKPGDAPVNAVSGILIGQVVDTSGRPVPRAAVRLIGDTVIETVLTDPRGRFYFRSIPPGNAIVTAQKFGFFDGAYGKRRATGQPLPFLLGAGQVLTDMRIEIFAAGVITGYVVDEAGEPIPGARVVASRRQFAEGNWQYIAAESDVTDDEGAYRIFGLLPGEYIVATPATSFSVAAQILDAMGATAADPRAGVTSDGRDVVWSTGATPPDDDGVAGIYPGQFYPATDHRILALPIMIGSGDVRHAVNFRLPLVPARRVTGQLVGEPDAVARQVIRLMPAGAGAAPGDEAATTVSNDDGSFTFARVPPGRYELEAGNWATTMRAVITTPASPAQGADETTPLAFWGRADVEVSDENVTVPTIPMRPTVPISGELVFDTSADPAVTVPSAGRVSIAIEPARPGLSLPGRVRPKPDGTFAVTNVLPGDYFIRVGALPPGWSLKSVTADRRDALDEPVEVGELGTDTIVVTLTPRGTEILGTVRDARTQVVPGAAVIVLPITASGDTAWTPNRTRETRTTAGGVFSISGLPPGDYYVVAVDDASAEGWQDSSVVSALRAVATRITLRDQEFRSLNLRVSTLRR